MTGAKVTGEVTENGLLTVVLTLQNCEDGGVASLVGVASSIVGWIKLMKSDKFNKELASPS